MAVSTGSSALLTAPGADTLWAASAAAYRERQGSLDGPRLSVLLSLLVPTAACRVSLLSRSSLRAWLKWLLPHSAVAVEQHQIHAYLPGLVGSQGAIVSCGQLSAPWLVPSKDCVEHCCALGGSQHGIAQANQPPCGNHVLQPAAPAGHFIRQWPSLKTLNRF